MGNERSFACACICAFVLGCGSEAPADQGTGLWPSTGDEDASSAGDGAADGDAADGSSADGNGADGSSSDGTSADGNFADGGSGEDGSSGDGGAEDGSDAEPPPPSCLDGITNYAEEGKFSFEAVTSGSVKLWVPEVPAGCKVPVVHLANGTGARCSSYAAVLQHLASHGFLATCYEDTNTGQGTQCIMALETAYAEYPELADDKIGSTGHSQGGGAAFMCVSRAEEKWGSSKIYAGHSMEPASGYGDSPANWQDFYADIESPMFMFNGSSDFLVSASWVRQAFDALPDSTEAYWYEATGAAHIPVPTRWTQESAVAWFRWKLLGDREACEYFKQMPQGNDWEAMEEQAATDC